VVVDHLSRLPTSLRNDGGCDLPSDDSFEDDHLFALAISSFLWLADFVNYLAYGIVLPGMDSNQRKQFFSQAKSYFWEEPCLYKACGDGIIRQCVLEEQISSIISHFHEMPCGGHASGDKAAAKILQDSFY